MNDPEIDDMIRRNPNDVTQAPRSGPVHGTVPVKPLTYLACPYSHPDPAVEDSRYVKATVAAAWLIEKLGKNVFSPITHSHPLARIGKLRHDWKFWERIDTDYLDCSHELVVLELDGWRTSVGVQAEIQIAREKSIPIYYLMPNANGYDMAPYPMDEAKSSTDGQYGKDIYNTRGCPETWQETNQPTPVPEGMDNPKDLIGVTKPPLRLIPAAALLYLAKAMEHGAKKYGPYNWRQKAVRYTVYLEAAMRHILAALDGEELDPESKQPHTAHAMACMGIILDAQSIGKIRDDRPTPGAAPRLIKEMSGK